MAHTYKILVPTNFSDCSENALRIASKIGSYTNAEIFLIHILDYSGYVLALDTSLLNNISLNEMYTELRANSTEKIEALKEKYQTTDCPITTVIESGIPTDEIHQFETLNDIDLIVSGTKGANNISDELIGTVTDQIVRKAHCPVLSIHESIFNFDPQTIVFASTFKETLGDNIERIKELTQMFNANLNLVRINTISDFESTRYSRKLMKDFVSKWNIEGAKMDIYDHENFESGLFYYAVDVKADLVILGNHGRKTLSHIYHGGSKSEDIVNHLKLPVLTFRIKHN